MSATCFSLIKSAPKLRGSTVLHHDSPCNVCTLEVCQAELPCLSRELHICRCSWLLSHTEKCAAKHTHTSGTWKQMKANTTRKTSWNRLECEWHHRAAVHGGILVILSTLVLNSDMDRLIRACLESKSRTQFWQWHFTGLEYHTVKQNRYCCLLFMKKRKSKKTNVEKHSFLLTWLNPSLSLQFSRATSCCHLVLRESSA